MTSRWISPLNSLFNARQIVTMCDSLPSGEVSLNSLPVRILYIVCVNSRGEPRSRFLVCSMSELNSRIV